MAEDVSRETTGVLLPPEISSKIWQSVQEQSVIMRLAQYIPLPGAGMSIPIISGDPTAEWVNETDEKPVSVPAFANKLMTGYTMAVIVPFSNQFRRDKQALYNACVKRLPGVLAAKLDKTVFGPASGAPGANFDTLGDAGAVSIATNTYTSLVTADGMIATGDGILSGWAISPQARKILLTALDTTGRPIFINNVQSDNAVPALLGAPVYPSKGVYIPAKPAAGSDPSVPAQVGFAGDWSGALYGVVEDITLKLSDQATLTTDEGTINLWQRNMFAVMVEFEVGFRVKNIAQFAKLTG